MIGIGNMRLQELIWEKLSKYKYNSDDFKLNKYFIEEIYPDSNSIIVRDNENSNYFSIPYIVDNQEVIINENDKKLVDKEWHERPLIENRFSYIFAKKEYGSGETLEVDKSSEAVSNKQWGDVDKTELRHKVLNAKNYKTLVYDVYAQVEDGWEDSPSNKLKYPIMLIDGGKVVYSRYGLASALGYAKAENNNKVVAKVEKLYEKLNIGEKEDNMEDKVTEVKNELNEDTCLKDDDIKDVKVEVDEESNNDYWKDKYEELEKAYKSIESELQGYKLAEDRNAMRDYLNSFKKCFNDDEYNIMASKIDNVCKTDFEKEVDDKVKEFVKNMSVSDTKSKEDEVLQTYSVVNDVEFIKPNNKISTLDDVIGSFK